MKKIKCNVCDIVMDFPETGLVSCKCENLTLNANERVVLCEKGESSYCMKDDLEDNEEPKNTEKPTKQELLGMLKEMRENIEKLPQHAQGTPVTNYDLLSLILVLEGLFASP